MTSNRLSKAASLRGTQTTHYSDAGSGTTGCELGAGYGIVVVLSCIGKSVNVHRLPSGGLGGVIRALDHVKNAAMNGSGVHLTGGSSVNVLEHLSTVSIPSTGLRECKLVHDAGVNGIMETVTNNNDLLATAAETAWLEYARGTFMQIDKRVFMAGWQAAIRYADKKASEGIEHLDEECCHFQD